MKSESNQALAEAVSIGRDAAGYGFDWPDLAGVLDKVAEERDELLEAIAGGDRDEIEAELGDLLFALASVARHLEVDPEAALAGATRRFRARFRSMDESIVADGLRWHDLSLAQLEARWQQAKGKHG